MTTIWLVESLILVTVAWFLGWVVWVFIDESRHHREISRIRDESRRILLEMRLRGPTPPDDVMPGL